MTKITTAPKTESVRFAASKSMHLPATPDKVFPLLCPIREYDWIEVWKCDLIHSMSGAAERDCVFFTDFRDCGDEIWTCTRYEPNHTVEYVRFAPLGVITHLSIVLAPDGRGGTNVLWQSVLTGTTDAGREYVAGHTMERYEQEAGAIEHMLGYYLKKGECLPVSAMTSDLKSGS